MSDTTRAGTTAPEPTTAHPTRPETTTARPTMPGATMPRSHSSEPTASASTAASLRPRRAAAAWRSGATWTGAILLASLVLLAIIGPWLTGHDPTVLAPADRLQPPSSVHWLGTDDLGRDVFARLAHGARSSLAIAAAVSVLSILLGTLLGLVATLHPIVDAVTMRATDGLMAFPSVLLGLTIVVRLDATVPSVILALTLVSTPVVARLVRTQALVARAQPHVEATRALGASEPRLLLRHVLPNAISPLLAQWSFIAGLAVLAEASLAFLGAGAGAGTWGALLRDGQAFLATAWWIAVPAGVALTATVLACTFLGDGLRDALDPRQGQASARRAGSTRDPRVSMARRGSGPHGGPKET